MAKEPPQGTRNPWSDDTWNISQQGVFVRQFGIDIAREWAASAGTTVGGLRPQPRKPKAGPPGPRGPKGVPGEPGATGSGGSGGGSSQPSPYDVGFAYGFAIPGDGSELAAHVAARTFVLPGDFGSSVAILRVAVSMQSLSFPILKNDTEIGAIDFEIGVDVQGDGSQHGTFVPLSPPADISFTRFDRVRVLAPSDSDPTASGLILTFAGIAQAG